GDYIAGRGIILRQTFTVSGATSIFTMDTEKERYLRDSTDRRIEHTRPRQLAQIVDESALVCEDGIAMQDAQEQHNGKAPLANDRWCHCAATMQESTAEKFYWLSGFSNEPVVDAFGHTDSSAVRINERLQYETGYSSYSHGVDGHSIADSEGLTNHNANGSL
ncbi:hypothetical protein ALC62_09977, partial [Cyphomyrmex costatus]